MNDHVKEKRARRPQVLWIWDGDRSTPCAREVMEWERKHETELSTVDCAELSEALLTKSEAENPQAIIYSCDLGQLPKTVRVVRAVHPVVQLVLLGPEEDRATFSDQLRITPSAGPYWMYASLDRGELEAVMRDALRSTRQRTQFRKTLSGINRQLKQRRDALPLDYERLVNSDRLLASVLRASQDGLLVIDPQLRVVEWNPSCEGIFGLERLEAIGRTIGNLLKGPDYAVLEVSIQSVLSSGQSLSRELVLESSAKESIEIEVTISLVPALEGGSQEVVAIQARDVSQRRKLDRALMAAKEEAEAANRTKSEFLANMSHEIRTPMTSILGFAEILEDRLKDPENQEFMRTIRQNGEFLLRIINDILDISKIEAGRLEIESKRINPLELAETVAEMMRVRAEKSGQKFELLAVEDAPSEIMGDAVRIRQILINLVGNAVKFTPDGGQVQLKLDRQDGFIAYEVSDTGPGIPKEEQERIFAPFSQSTAHSNPSFGGTGLGLTISRRLAKMMNGNVTVESEPGKGSRFTLLLPCQAAESEQDGDALNG